MKFSKLMRAMLMTAVMAVLWAMWAMPCFALNERGDFTRWGENDFQGKVKIHGVELTATATEINAQAARTNVTVTKQTGAVTATAVVTSQTGTITATAVITPQTISLTDTNGVTAIVWTNATCAVTIVGGGLVMTNATAAITVVGGGAVVTNVTAVLP